MVAGVVHLGVVWQGIRWVGGRVRAVRQRSSSLPMPSHTRFSLSSTFNCKTKVSCKLNDGTSWVRERSALSFPSDDARAGKSIWVISGMVELGASWSGDGSGRPSLACNGRWPAPHDLVDFGECSVNIIAIGGL